MIPTLFGPVLKFDSSKAHSPAEGYTYLCDFRRHARLVCEPELALEDVLSQQEMEVTTMSTHGDGKGSQAGKEGSLRMLWFLKLLCIGRRKETSE